MARFLKIAGLGIIGLGFVSLILFVIVPKDAEGGFRNYINSLVGVKCIDYRQGNFSKKLSDKIPDYIGKSSLSGIVKCKDESEILERVNEGKLVEVNEGNGFVIREMTHSYPYLTRDGKDLLLEIGKRFREKISGTTLKGSSFKITSMTRTTDKLKELREVNPNASAYSPHLYGNTFDISYIRFSVKKWYLTNCDRTFLKEALAEVIWQLREEKKCWATYEKKQNCFHVVAR